MPSLNWNSHTYKKCALLVAALLPCCSTTALDASNVALPTCQDGQLLSAGADQTLTCVSIFANGMIPPACDPDTQALSSGLRDTPPVVRAYCAIKGTGLGDVPTELRIGSAADAVTSLWTQTSELMINATPGRYIGLSSMTVKGRIWFQNYIGLMAAANFCQADYGVGAHMCTPFEIYESVIAANILDGSADVGPGWVYLQGWNNPRGVDPTFALDGYGGMMDNCGAYMSDLQSTQWEGTTFLFSAPLPGAVRVPQFNAATPCYTVQPIACCKQS